MIHLEIIQCPDLNVKSTFKYFKNELYLGSGSPDLSINDPSLQANHLLIEIPEKDLLAHPQKHVPFYLLNDKRTTAIRKIKVGDTLTIGNTTIKILDFSMTELPSKKELLNAKLAKLIETSSARLPAIEKVSKMMK